MNANEYTNLITDAKYICYRYNRDRTPDATPSEWSKIFPDWESLEKIYQAELPLRPIISKLEEIAMDNKAKWGMTENGFTIQVSDSRFCFVIVGEITEALKDTDVVITTHPASKTITVRKA